MIEDQFFREFGLSLDEILALKHMTQNRIFGTKGNYSRLLTTSRHVSFSSHVADQLLSCSQLFSLVGIYNLIGLTRDNRELCEDWQNVLERLFADPIAVRNRTVWLLLQACLDAQQDFSLVALPARSDETFLTGRFIEKISAACQRWAEKAQAFLDRREKVLEVSQIDMSVGGYEQGTGSDLAIILDIEDDWSASDDVAPSTLAHTGPLRGDVIIPLLFQVKRFTGSTADVSQHHKKRGYQFDVLRQTDCASNYLFFENGEYRVEGPALPIVKSTCDMEAVEMQSHTDVFIKSVDFATYIAQAISGLHSIPFAESREDALNMILAGASADRLTRITLLGNTSGLQHEYEKALRDLRHRIDNPPSPQKRPGK